MPSKQAILDCVEKGMSNKQIYEHLNISKSTLLRKCKLLGISLSRNASSEVLNSLTEERFKGFLEKGYTLDEAAEEAGVSRSYLAKKASELKVSFSKNKFNLEEYLKLKDTGMLDKDIAARFGMTPHGLHGRKVDFNLELQDRNFKVVSKEELEELYLVKKMPIEEISKRLNKGVTPIYEYLKKYNLILRREDGINIKKLDLERLLEEKTTYSDIANQFRTTSDSVKRAAIRNSLDTEELFSEEGKSLNKFTTIQKQLIYGSLLGDGYIDEGHINCRLKFEHGLKQKEYVKFKHEILDNFIEKRGITLNARFDKRTGKYHTHVTARTIQSKIFTDIYPLFYNPIKYVNLEVLNSLDERGLSFWFMDDGYKYNDYGLVLCTESFSDEDLNKIVEYFKERWGIDSEINTKLRRIFFKEKAAITFQNLISPYMLPLFDYKLITPENIIKLNQRCSSR